METLLQFAGKCYNPYGVIVFGIIALFFIVIFYKLKGQSLKCIRMQ